MRQTSSAQLERLPRAAFNAVGEPCRHEQMCVLAGSGSTLDDHSTHYGYCPTCDAYLVVTEYANGNIESRAMTADELEKFGAAEDRAQRDEWLCDFQEGAA